MRREPMYQCRPTTRPRMTVSAAMPRMKRRMGTCEKPAAATSRPESAIVGRI